MDPSIHPTRAWRPSSSADVMSAVVAHLHPCARYSWSLTCRFSYPESPPLLPVSTKNDMVVSAATINVEKLLDTKSLQVEYYVGDRLSGDPTNF